MVVNVGRAGAANLDVIQEVEYVKREAKIMYLLETLQKTAPPTLIFASNQSDVDDIHEYLLLKGIDAVAIHGALDQSVRVKAIEEFKRGEKDVLVATDVASKGLDFPDIQHVSHSAVASGCSDVFMHGDIRIDAPRFELALSRRSSVTHRQLSLCLSCLRFDLSRCGR